MKATEANQLSISDPKSRTPFLYWNGHNSPQELAPTSIANIALQVPDDAKLASGLVYPSKKVPNLTCIKDYLGMLSSADNPTPEGKATAFVSYSTSKVQVEFEVVARRLRQNVVESVTRDKHGSEGVRILRLLSHSGKLDEKQVCLSHNTFSFIFELWL